jgi:riboflavin kinase/FMN adenylyltransferase
MRLIRGLHNLHASDRACVATIGNFDGVHLGHRAVFRRLIDLARAHQAVATVITFEPQPMEFFAPAQAPARLTRLREKARIMAEDGIGQLVVLRFDRHLAALDPESFVTRLLVEGLGVRYLLVGDDFRFGHKRAGDFQLLRECGGRFGFDVANLPTVHDGQERISSTRVRAALADADLALAQRLLGRPFFLHGRVAHGDKRGRTLGFPTANLHLHRHSTPVSGVYAVRVHGLGPVARPAVANVGSRPTVAGTDSRLEVHLFDFDQDIYGAHLRVEFCAWLRHEQKFPSLAALQEQIARDSAAARQFFAISPTPSPSL